MNDMVDPMVGSVVRHKVSACRVTRGAVDEDDTRNLVSWLYSPDALLDGRTGRQHKLDNGIEIVVSSWQKSCQ